MQEKPFDNLIADSQGTVVEPVSPSKFDFERYDDYEAALLERSRAFWQASGGLAVYRRFRVSHVYTFGCRDMETSLALQLGALQESLKYEMDIPNFLEPWYGIGTIAAAFGAEYEWRPGQAPAIESGRRRPALQSGYAAVFHRGSKTWVSSVMAADLCQILLKAG